jgi:hypothetical protein
MKKLFVVVVSDLGNGHMDSPHIFHIRAENSAKALDCAKDTFIEDYSFDEETIEDDFDFFAFELTDDAIIDA